MLKNESILQVLKIKISHAAIRGETVVNADAEIASLAPYFPRTVKFDVDGLRSEIVAIARRHGLAVEMGRP